MWNNQNTTPKKNYKVNNGSQHFLQHSMFDEYELRRPDDDFNRLIHQQSYVQRGSDVKKPKSCLKQSQHGRRISKQARSRLRHVRWNPNIEIFAFKKKELVTHYVYGNERLVEKGDGQSYLLDERPTTSRSSVRDNNNNKNDSRDGSSIKSHCTCDGCKGDNYYSKQQTDLPVSKSVKNQTSMKRFVDNNGHYSNYSNMSQFHLDQQYTQARYDGKRTFEKYDSKYCDCVRCRRGNDGSYNKNNNMKQRSYEDSNRKFYDDEKYDYHQHHQKIRNRSNTMEQRSYENINCKYNNDEEIDYHRHHKGVRIMSTTPARRRYDKRYKHPDSYRSSK